MGLNILFRQRVYTFRAYLVRMKAFWWSYFGAQIIYKRANKARPLV
jgi:hypothetical protein